MDQKSLKIGLECIKTYEIYTFTLDSVDLKSQVK